MSTPDSPTADKKHPWEVFGAALTKPLQCCAVCVTAGCESSALKSRGIGSASNSHTANLMQWLCEACSRRCRVCADLVRGGQACEGLLAEYDPMKDECRETIAWKRIRPSPSNTPAAGTSQFQPTLFKAWTTVSVAAARTEDEVEHRSAAFSFVAPPPTMPRAAAFTFAAPSPTANAPPDTSAAIMNPSQPQRTTAEPSSANARAAPAVARPPHPARSRNPSPERRTDAPAADTEVAVLLAQLRLMEARVDEISKLVHFMAAANPGAHALPAPLCGIPAPNAPAPKTTEIDEIRGRAQPKKGKRTSPDEMLGPKLAGAAATFALAATSAAPGATAPPRAPAPAPTTAHVVSAPPPATAGADAPETFATVAKRGARRLIPPPIAKPKQPLTREQYDAKVRQSRVRDAIRIATPLGPPKQFAVVRVALHNNRQLRDARGNDRTALLTQLTSQMAIRPFVALVSSIGNSIVEFYCLRESLPTVIRTLIDRKQKVLQHDFNPHTTNLYGLPLPEEEEKLAAHRVAHLVARAPTANVRAAILRDVTPTIKELARSIHDGLQRKTGPFEPGTRAPAVHKHAVTDPEAWLATENIIFMRIQKQLEAARMSTVTAVNHRMTTDTPNDRATGASDY
ncbi:hypothetical protein HDU83_008763 [Entophlyctis luteolus]|nr:hypothetical protein HDU83_008763 [Entophlyctis luteolus]